MWDPQIDNDHNLQFSLQLTHANSADTLPNQGRRLKPFFYSDPTSIGNAFFTITVLNYGRRQHNNDDNKKKVTEWIKNSAGE
jgi:hypothetical protein